MNLPLGITEIPVVSSLVYFSPAGAWMIQRESGLLHAMTVRARKREIRYFMVLGIRFRVWGIGGFNYNHSENSSFKIRFGILELVFESNNSIFAKANHSTKISYVKNLFFRGADHATIMAPVDFRRGYPDGRFYSINGIPHGMEYDA